MSSGSPADVEIINEAAERAVEELLDLYDTLIPRNVGPTGMSYGLQEMDRGKRIEAFLWRAQSGALDLLRTVSQKVYDDYVKEYLEDIGKTPMYARTQQMETLRVALEREQMIGGLQ